MAISCDAPKTGESSEGNEDIQVSVETTESNDAKNERYKRNLANLKPLFKNWEAQDVVGAINLQTNNFIKIGIDHREIYRNKEE